MQRVVEHLDNIQVAPVARSHGNRAVGPRLEDDAHIVHFGDGVQQGEPRPHIGPPPKLEFTNAEVVRDVDIDESGRIDPVSRNDLRCFP